MKSMKKMMNGIKNMALAALVLLAGVAPASPASTILKCGKEGLAEVAEKVGLKTAGKKAVVRGGAEFAAFKAAQKTAEKAATRMTEGTVKAIRPGQILAVSGGIATIEGAHQLTDGARNALTNVVETLGKDPQVAGKALDGVFKPAGIALGIVVLAGAGLLIWMLYPLFGTVHAYFARKMRQPVEPAVVAASGADEALARRSHRSGYTRIEIVVVAAGFILLTATGIHSCLSERSDASSPVGGASQPSVRREVARERLAALKNDYHAALARHYEQFQADVRPSVERAYAPVMEAIPSVTARYGAFGKLTHVVKTMVVDKLCKRNNTGREIEADLRSCYYPAIKRAQEQSTESCRDLVNALAQEREKYVANVRALQIKIPEDMDRDFTATMETSAESINQVQQKLASAQNGALFSSAVEAACIRSTISTIGKFLGKIVARQAGTMAASAGAACADGPLPIGDIAGGVMTIGCTCWTVYDIYKACKIVPAELYRTLVQATYDCRDATVKSVDKLGETIYSAFLGE